MPQTRVNGNFDKTFINVKNLLRNNYVAGFQNL